MQCGMVCVALPHASTCAPCASETARSSTTRRAAMRSASSAKWRWPVDTPPFRHMPHPVSPICQKLLLFFRFFRGGQWCIRGPCGRQVERDRRALSEPVATARLPRPDEEPQGGRAQGTHPIRTGAPECSARLRGTLRIHQGPRTGRRAAGAKT